MRGEGHSSRPARVIGYARVSSQDQALGTSLQDQQNAVKAYAKTRGLTVAHFFVEAESAVHEKFERREQMQELMRSARAGDLILCDKVDRWSRDPEFTYKSMRELREVGAVVFFVGEQLDPSTPEGDTALNFRVLFAREEHKRIRLRMVGTRLLLRDKGLYVEGLPPLGYKRRLPKGQRSKDVEKNALAIDPDGQRLVLELYRRCVGGWSISDLLSWARHQTKAPAETKSRAWDKKTINVLLRNRIYLGEIRDTRGVWIRAQHDPIVAPDLFARAQAALDSRRLAGAKPRGDSRTSKWALRDLAICARCGAKMGAAYGAGFGKAKDYIYYYRCTKKCGARYVPIGPSEDATDQAIVDRITALKDWLAKVPKEASANHPVEDFSLRRTQLAQKRERAIEAFTDGDISRDELRVTTARLDKLRTKLDAEEASAARRSSALDPAARKAFLGVVSNLRKAWAEASVAEKRELLATFTSAVRLERDKPPIFVWRSPEEMSRNLPV